MSLTSLSISPGRRMQPMYLRSGSREPIQSKSRDQIHALQCPEAPNHRAPDDNDWDQFPAAPESSFSHEYYPRNGIGNDLASVYFTYSNSDFDEHAVFAAIALVLPLHLSIICNSSVATSPSSAGFGTVVMPLLRSILGEWRYRCRT